MQSCEALTRKNHICSNKATYCVNLEGETVNYCGVHNNEIITKFDYSYNPKENKLTVGRISRVKHDKLTGLPERYTQDLTDDEKLEWKKQIDETNKLYVEDKKVRGRSPVSGLKPKRSHYVEEFENKYGFSISDDIKLQKYFSDTDIDKILSKGRAAYASGSRPTVTGSGGPEQWARARLASVFVGGKALEIDKNLVGPKSLKKIFS